MLASDDEGSVRRTPESSVFKLSLWNAKMGVEMKELAADHVDWLERINGIIQKINSTEGTVKR